MSSRNFSAGRVGPQGFKNIHGIDEADRSRSGRVGIDMFGDESKIESIDVVSKQCKVSGKVESMDGFFGEGVLDIRIANS